MKEEARKQVLEIIRKTIDEVAFEELASMPANLAKKAEQVKMTKAQRSDQTHNDLFYGGATKADINTRFRLSESMKINVSSKEIAAFQEELAKHLQGHTIKFEDQVVGGVTSNVGFPVVDGTVDAIVIGNIDSQLQFSMSLKGGLEILTNRFKVTDENKELVTKLHNLFNTVFKPKFTDILSSTDDSETATPGMDAPEAPMAPESPVEEPSPEAGVEGAGM